MSFAIPDARARFFPTRESYLAYQSAWKAFSASRKGLTPAHYAAHAILTGADLYKAFSPSHRAHDAAEPYRTLRLTLLQLAKFADTPRYCKFEHRHLTAEHNDVLQSAFLLACSAAKGLGRSALERPSAVGTGLGQFAATKAEA